MPPPGFQIRQLQGDMFLSQMCCLTVLCFFIAACTVSLVLLCGLYGALESVIVLRRLRNCRDIIIIYYHYYYYPRLLPFLR